MGVTPSPDAGVEAVSLYRFFRSGEEEIVALRGVSLSVPRGDFVAVTGPSGSGKSTLLSCLAGSDDPDGGRVYVAGERISHRPESVRSRLRSARIGLLYQRANLFDHLTVEGNVLFVQRLTRRAAHDDTKTLLSLVGLARRSTAYPGQLSGGELARAGLAVALANDPPVLLADEPTGELDTHSERSILTLLQNVAERGTAVVVASHSRDVAAAAARVVRLADGAVAS
jgi:putative ABC transport system ATP-binding protein